MALASGLHYSEPGLFSILVLMAIVTTVMATPLFNWIMRRSAPVAVSEPHVPQI